MYVQTSEGLGQPQKNKAYLNLDHFISDKASLIDRLRSMANNFANSVVQSWTSTQPIEVIRLVGHTDNTGAEKYNIGLGDRRAKAVEDALRDKLKGLSGRVRIVVEPSPGESEPTADNRTTEGRGRNRRVEVFITTGAVTTVPKCENRIRTVTVWLNAFIPRDVAGLTKKVSDSGANKDSSMAGKTMFDTVAGCGLTDQRSFSAEINASSRMHSEAKIDLDKPRLIYQKHRIGPSTVVRCMTGFATCKEISTNVSMNFKFLGVSSNDEIMIQVKGSGGPGCIGALTRKVAEFLLDAKIDYGGTFYIKRVARNYVDIGFLGTVDLFPAYEFVAMLNDSNPVHLGGKLPPPGSSPVTHLGTKQKIHFVRRLWLKCENGKEIAGSMKIIN